ncbi:MAG TPA: hypothetical protein VFL57_06790, partial [Bryobacteraceae bacterium]|nr:hypothetical protein [Bryobacteraceae bacterium]
MRTNRRSLLHAGLLAVALAGAFGGIALYRVARAVSEAGIALDAEASVAVSRSRLHRPAAPAIEYLPAPAAFRDAAVFAGRLYLGGGPGIVAVDELGRITDSWRTGERLPAAVIALAASSSELWIAAAGAGLLRYDGSDFEQILPADAGLRSFTAILPVATGGVLLGTAGRGVLIYDGKRLRAFHPELARGRANALAGSDTDLWVATSDRGLLHLRGGQLQTFSERDGLPDANVLSLAVSGERVWAGTALGVAEFSAARFTRVVGEGLFARALYERASELLVGTLETGAYRIPLASRRPSSWPAPFSGSVEKILRWSGR